MMEYWINLRPSGIFLDACGEIGNHSFPDPLQIFQESSPLLRREMLTHLYRFKEENKTLVDSIMTTKEEKESSQYHARIWD